MKKYLALAAIVPIMIGVLAITKAQPAEAMTNSNDLGNLIVTNGLFTGYNAQDLAGLMATDAVTGGSDGALGSGSDLNDLLVLGGLFGTGNGWGWNNGAENLAGLIAVDNMFNNGF